MYKRESLYLCTTVWLAGGQGGIRSTARVYPPGLPHHRTSWSYPSPSYSSHLTPHFPAVYPLAEYSTPEPLATAIVGRYHTPFAIHDPPLELWFPNIYTETYLDVHLHSMKLSCRPKKDLEGKKGLVRLCLPL